ncbi:MAG TPA: hypothetical protein VGJ13_21540 [Pseudonocardiaceae bacterium]
MSRARCPAGIAGDVLHLPGWSRWLRAARILFTLPPPRLAGQALLVASALARR